MPGAVEHPPVDHDVQGPVELAAADGIEPVPHHRPVTPLISQELEHSAAATSTGLFRTTRKNAFKPKATVRSVFGRHRPATNSRYRSTSRLPNR
jgi:hypothetical protein